MRVCRCVCVCACGVFEYACVSVRTSTYTFAPTCACEGHVCMPACSCKCCAKLCQRIGPCHHQEPHSYVRRNWVRVCACKCMRIKSVRRLVCVRGLVRVHACALASLAVRACAGGRTTGATTWWPTCARVNLREFNLDVCGHCDPHLQMTIGVQDSMRRNVGDLHVTP